MLHGPGLVAFLRAFLSSFALCSCWYTGCYDWLQVLQRLVEGFKSLVGQLVTATTNQMIGRGLRFPLVRAFTAFAKESCYVIWRNEGPAEGF